MTVEAPPVPTESRARWGRRLARLLFRMLYRVRTVGWDRVPATGPVILAPNHTGFLDGPFAFAEAPRPTHFLVYDRTFETAWGPVLTAVGMIPIDQKVGDRTALNTALAVLKRGGSLGIFPEGGRGRGDLSRAGQGVAWIALQSGAPVVPVALLGIRRTGEHADDWPRLRSTLVADFGDPIHLDVPSGVPGRERLRLASNQVRAGLVAHIHDAVSRHGIPLPDDVPEGLMD